jgi:hypothetical protein
MVPGGDGQTNGLRSGARVRENGRCDTDCYARGAEALVGSCGKKRREREIRELDRQSSVSHSET